MDYPLHIYLTTSHISTVYSIVHAKHSHNGKNVIVIDYAPKKKSLLKHMYTCIHQMEWTKVVDFSTAIHDETNIKPGFRKRLVRRLKTNFLIKPVYDSLLKAYMKKDNERLLLMMDKKLNEFKGEKNIRLYFLYQTRLNDVLSAYFPQAEIHFIEHGLGDYIFNLSSKDQFHCVFAESYKNYLQKKQLPSQHVHSYFNESTFTEICSAEKFENLPVISNDTVLFIMQPLDIYNVKGNFWKALCEKLVEVTELRKNQTLLVKPHPLQSNESRDWVKHYFESRNYTIIFINDTHSNAGIEVLFPHIKANVKYVFSLFSSSVFYLSAFNRDAEIRFYYSYDFLKHYLHNAPLQFKNRYLEGEELIREIFAQRCIEFK